MPMVLRRIGEETWREAAARYGRRCGLEAEVLAFFDDERACGADECDAAWAACYEWDVLDFEPSAEADQ